MFLGALVQDLDILDVAGILQTATTKVNVLLSLLQHQHLHTHPTKPRLLHKRTSAGLKMVS
jgi:hypothetical protein